MPMNRPASPPDSTDRLDQLLGEARSLVLDLISLAAGVLMLDVSLRGLRKAMGRYIVPAEAAMRRAIILIASTLTLPASKAAKRATPAKRAKPARRRVSLGGADRDPVFRLTEPSGPANTGAGAIPVPALAETKARAPRRPADFAAFAARFARRLAALEAACADPAAEARRWLLKARKAAARAEPPGALRFGRIPGNRPHLGPARRQTLFRLNEAAQHLLLPHNTS